MVRKAKLHLFANPALAPAAKSAAHQLFSLGGTKINIIAKNRYFRR